MNFLITNAILDSPMTYKNLKIVYFNPWGFSKIGIINQIEQTLSESQLTNQDTLYIYLEPYFFGRRSKIVVEHCVGSFKTHVKELNYREFKSLLNDSPI